MKNKAAYNSHIHYPIYPKLHRLHLGSTQNAYICPNLHMLIAPPAVVGNHIIVASSWNLPHTSTLTTYVRTEFHVWPPLNGSVASPKNSQKPWWWCLVIHRILTAWLHLPVSCAVRCASPGVHRLPRRVHVLGPDHRCLQLWLHLLFHIFLINDNKCGQITLWNEKSIGIFKQISVWINRWTNKLINE